MTAAIVLYFDQPFDVVDATIGLSKAAEIRMASAGLARPVEVLVVRGFEQIPEASRMRLAELRYNMVDASSALAAVRREHPFANDARVWRDDPFHEFCFLRWLVLEKHFGDMPILAMDADIVWRVDSDELFQSWTKGGSSLCFSSPCLAFIKGRNWYESYRSGLARLAENSGFGSEYKKDHFHGLYHDQALIQYLSQLGEIEDDTENFSGRGLSDRYYLMSNPLGISPALAGSPLTFERRGHSDVIDGKVVPYWHMQTRFTRYLWAARALPVLLDRKVRIPYEGYVDEDPDVASLLVKKIHHLIRRGHLTLNHRRHAPLAALANRRAVYGEFFDGDLASEVFRSDTWWKPGVWA